MRTHRSSTVNDRIILSLTYSVLDQLVSMSEKARPREAVAALYGHSVCDRFYISSAQEIVNRARSSGQFIIDGQSLNNAMALFHSHAKSQTFSRQDQKQIIRTKIPWVVGFPLTRRHSSAPSLHYANWVFHGACSRSESRIHTCQLFITQGEH